MLSQEFKMSQACVRWQVAALPDPDSCEWGVQHWLTTHPAPPTPHLRNSYAARGGVHGQNVGEGPGELEGGAAGAAAKHECRRWTALPCISQGRPGNCLIVARLEAASRVLAIGGGPATGACHGTSMAMGRCPAPGCNRQTVASTRQVGRQARARSYAAPMFCTQGCTFYV